MGGVVLGVLWNGLMIEEASLLSFGGLRERMFGRLC
jgi:hypothetical protein